jgi:hypothetical protein
MGQKCAASFCRARIEWSGLRAVLVYLDTSGWAAVGTHPLWLKKKKNGRYITRLPDYGWNATTADSLLMCSLFGVRPRRSFGLQLPCSLLAWAECIV